MTGTLRNAAFSKENHTVDKPYVSTLTKNVVTQTNQHTSWFVESERTVIIPKHCEGVPVARQPTHSVVLLLHYVNIAVHAANPVRRGEVTQICLQIRRI
jgi:hypothetical protein